MITVNSTYFFASVLKAESNIITPMASPLKSHLWKRGILTVKINIGTLYIKMTKKIVSKSNKITALCLLILVVKYQTKKMIITVVVYCLS